MDEIKAYNDKWKKELESEESGQCGVIDREPTSGPFD